MAAWFTLYNTDQILPFEMLCTHDTNDGQQKSKQQQRWGNPQCQDAESILHRIKDHQTVGACCQADGAGKTQIVLLEKHIRNANETIQGTWLNCVK